MKRSNVDLAPDESTSLDLKASDLPLSASVCRTRRLRVCQASTAGRLHVVLTFSDTKGGTAKQTGQIHSALGTWTGLDLTAADLPPDLARAPRVEVLPSLANSGRRALNSSVEVISTATG